MERVIIGTILKNRIRECGYTQEDFAYKAGIGISSLKKYLNGTTAYNYELLDTFSQILECSYDYLLGKSKSPNPEFKDISNQLRLSDEAIECVTKYAKQYDTNIHAKRYISVLDTLIQSEYFLDNVSIYMLNDKYTENAYNDIKQSISAGLNTDIPNPLTDIETIYLITIVTELNTIRNSIRKDLQTDLKRDGFEKSLTVLRALLEPNDNQEEQLR